MISNYNVKSKYLSTIYTLLHTVSNKVGTHVFDCICIQDFSWRHEIAWSEKSPTCVMGSQDNKKQRLPPLQTKACFLRLFGCGNLTKSKCIGILSWGVCSSCFRNIYMYLVVEFLKELHWSFDSLIYIYFKFSEVLSKHAQQLFARERAVEITAGLDDACCFDFVCGNSILSQILLTATHYKSS